MYSIGVREFKDALSKTLAYVATGERVIITSHGKPVAELVPPSESPADAHFHALVARGQITPASALPAELGPVEPVKLLGNQTATELVLEDRESDRI